MIRLMVGIQAGLGFGVIQAGLGLGTQNWNMARTRSNIRFENTPISSDLNSALDKVGVRLGLGLGQTRLGLD